MGKRQQIRRQVMKNPKRWYHCSNISYLPFFSIYFKEPFKTKSGWDCWENGWNKPYWGIIRKALIDCGELKEIHTTLLSTKRGIVDTPGYTYSKDVLCNKRFKLLIPRGELDSLPNLIQSHNENVLKRLTQEEARRAGMFDRRK